MLVPGLNYSFDTYLECQSDKGVSDNIKVSRILVQAVQQYFQFSLIQKFFVTATITQLQSVQCINYI